MDGRGVWGDLGGGGEIWLDCEEIANLVGSGQYYTFPVVICIEMISILNHKFHQEQEEIAMNHQIHVLSLHHVIHGDIYLSTTDSTVSKNAY